VKLPKKERCFILSLFFFPLALIMAYVVSDRTAPALR